MNKRQREAPSALNTYKNQREFIITQRVFVRAFIR